jgi:hypothetical protein
VRRPGGQKPIEAVRDLIQRKLVDALADTEGNRRVAALREKIDAAKLTTEEQWKGLADDVVTSNLTPFFGAEGGFVPGLGRDADLLAELATAKEGFVGGPRRTGRGWIVYRLDTTRKAGPTPFEEAKNEALEAVKRTRAVDRLKAEAETRLAALGAKPLTELATALRGRVEQVKDHRRDAAMPNVNTSKPLDDAVFATPAGMVTPVVRIGDRGVAVAKITEVNLMDASKFDGEKESLRKTMIQDESQNLLLSLLQDTRKDFPVAINPDVLERFKARE